MGVELYGFQQNLAKLYKDLTSTQVKYQVINQIRSQVWEQGMLMWAVQDHGRGVTAVTAS